MLKKVIASLISCSMVFTIAPWKIASAQDLNAKDLQSFKTEVSQKTYKKSKSWTDGNVMVTLQYNGPDDVKTIAYNKVTGITVESTTSEDSRKNIMATFITKDKSNNVVKNEKVMIPQSDIIAQEQLIKTDNINTDNVMPLSSGWPSDYIMDGLAFWRKYDYSSILGKKVAYNHPDPNYYEIGSNETATVYGNTYTYIQISSDTVNQIRDFTAGTIGGIVATIISAAGGGTILAGMAGAIVGGIVAGACAYAIDSYKDERGCVWESFDTNPTLISKVYNAELDCYTCRFYYTKTTFGPYERDNVYTTESRDS